MYSKSGGWVLNSLFVDQPVTWTAAYNQTISSWFESVFCINANYFSFDILCFELIALDRYSLIKVSPETGSVTVEQTISSRFVFHKITFGCLNKYDIPILTNG